MNDQAFSKIWIVVTLVILIAGGTLAWQYRDWIKFQLRPEIPMQPTPPYISKSWCTPELSSMGIYGNMLDRTGAEKHAIYGKTVDVCCYEGVIQYQEEEWVRNQDKAMIQFGKLGEGKGQGKMKYCLGTVAAEEYQIGWAYNEQKGQWLKYKEGHSAKDDVWEACTKIFDREGNAVEEFCYQP